MTLSNAVGRASPSSPCSHLSQPPPEKLGSPLPPSLLSALEDWGLGSQSCCPKAMPSAGPRRRCRGRAGSFQHRWELWEKAKTLLAWRGLPADAVSSSQAASQQLAKQMPRRGPQWPLESQRCPHTSPSQMQEDPFAGQGEREGACAESLGRLGAWGVSSVSSRTPDGNVALGVAWDHWLLPVPPSSGTRGISLLSCEALPRQVALTS